MDLLVGDYVPRAKRSRKSLAGELADRLRSRACTVAARTVAPRRGPLAWFRRAAPVSARTKSRSDREDRARRRLASRRRATTAWLRATYGALIRVVSAVRGQHGGLWGSPEVLAPLITGLACNVLRRGGHRDRVGPLIAEAAAAEALPTAAAAGAIHRDVDQRRIGGGKSTMRPLLRSLAARTGASWSDFALVSPDIFRRELLDIDSLGQHYKYFGTFTSHELEVVDRKLDRYLARQGATAIRRTCWSTASASTASLPIPRSKGSSSRGIATRRLVYYLFMITPPEKTVERAWKRGLAVGRYKPLDDLLAHNVDAYAGMQSFFLARALHPDSRNQHYEFVDNDVPMGEVPLTVAFGSGGEFNILDVKRLVDMERYRKINVDARRAGRSLSGRTDT